MFTILSIAAFILGFIYAAGASKRAAKLLPTESGEMPMEAKLLATAAATSDRIGIAKDRGALIAKKNGLRLLAATANAAANGAQKLSVSVAEQQRREQIAATR